MTVTRTEQICLSDSENLSRNIEEINKRMRELKKEFDKKEGREEETRRSEEED